jgi:hypothetical protein
VERDPEKDGLEEEPPPDGPAPLAPASESMKRRHAPGARNRRQRKRVKLLVKRANTALETVGHVASKLTGAALHGFLNAEEELLRIVRGENKADRAKQKRARKLNRDAKRARARRSR